MTTLNEAEEAILSKFVTDWADQTVYDLDNEDFSEPSSSTSWVRLVIRPNSLTQESLGQEGNRRFERGGNLFVQVFTPVNTGSKPSSLLTQAIVDIFEGTSFGGVTFTGANVRRLGPQGLWYQATVELSFTFDEIK